MFLGCILIRWLDSDYFQPGTSSLDRVRRIKWCFEFSALLAINSGLVIASASMRTPSLWLAASKHGSSVSKGFFSGTESQVQS